MTALTLVGALAFGGVAASPANATTSASRGAASVGTSVSTTTTNGVPANFGGPTAPSPSGVGENVQTSPQAVNFAIRLAVKGALEAMKRVASSQYHKLIGWVNKGKTAFVNWWNSKSAEPVRNTLAGLGISISGAALYDAICWVLGIK